MQRGSTIGLSNLQSYEGELLEEPSGHGFEEGECQGSVSEVSGKSACKASTYFLTGSEKERQTDTSENRCQTTNFLTPCDTKVTSANVTTDTRSA